MCELEPGSLWVVIASSGRVAERDCNGATWDVFGGAPEPTFCMTTDGAEQCASGGNDTLSASFSNFRFRRATAAVLMAGVPTSFVDGDADAPDVICRAASFAFTEAHFRAGRARYQCSCTGMTAESGSVEMALEPQ